MATLTTKNRTALTACHRIRKRFSEIRQKHKVTKGQDAKTQADHKQHEKHGRKLKAGESTPTFQHTTFGSSEVA